MINMHTVTTNIRTNGLKTLLVGGIAVGLILVACLLAVSNGGTATPNVAPSNQGGLEANAPAAPGNLVTAPQRSVAVDEYLQRIGPWALPRTNNSTERSGAATQEYLGRVGSWAPGYEYGGPIVTIDEYLGRVGSWAVHPASTGQQQP